MTRESFLFFATIRPSPSTTDAGVPRSSSGPAGERALELAGGAATRADALADAAGGAGEAGAEGGGSVEGKRGAELTTTEGATVLSSERGARWLSQPTSAKHAHVDAIQRVR